MVGEWISKAGESHDFGSILKAGENYILHEETAPSGYQKIADVSFKVEAITITGASDGVKLEDGT